MGDGFEFPQAEADRGGTELDQRLCRILREVLGLEALPETAELSTLGLSSLLAALLMARISETFGVELKAAQIAEATTVKELSRCIQSAEPVEASPVREPR